MGKVDYARRQVARAEEGGTHTCHWPGCTAVVPPAMWGCKPHWFAIPPLLRARLWAAYRPGQEVTKTPSLSYIVAAREVQEWIDGQAERAETARGVDTHTRDLFDGDVST